METPPAPTSHGPRSAVHSGGGESYGLPYGAPLGSSETDVQLCGRCPIPPSISHLWFSLRAF